MDSFYIYRNFKKNEPHLYDPEKPDWSIMTKSVSGIVSVNRDLTLKQAKFIYERLDPRYGEVIYKYEVHKDFPKDDDNIIKSDFGRTYTRSNGDIETFDLR